MFLKNNKYAANIVLKISSRTQSIRKVSDEILKSLEPYNIDEGRAFDIKLSIEEAVRNAIVHGNRSDRKLSVKVSWKVDAGAVIIEVEDEGKGFDHKAVLDPTHKENIMRTCGRGVFLIKKLMDEAEYVGAGNKLRMVKKLK